MGFRKDNNLESVNAELKKKKIKKFDRVFLNAESLQILEKLQNQVNGELRDLVQVSMKDTVNFIIQNRSPLFSQEEIGRMRLQNFDLVKALKKATSEALRAKQNGTELHIEEVLKIIQTPSVIKTPSSKRPYKITSNIDPRRDRQRAEDSNLKTLDDLKLALDQSAIG